MAKVNKEDIDRYKVEMAQIREYPENGSGFFKGPWLDDVYDNRSECWRDNIAAKRNKDRAEAGQNEQGQTPEQEKDFRKRLQRAKEVERAGEIAREQAIKAGLQIK